VGHGNVVDAVEKETDLLLACRMRHLGGPACNLSLPLIYLVWMLPREFSLSEPKFEFFTSIIRIRCANGLIFMLDPEDESCMYLRNVENNAHIHAGCLHFQGRPPRKMATYISEPSITSPISRSPVSTFRKYPQDGGSVYHRNVSSLSHIHTMQRSMERNQ
jgi:hypothetical protein